MILQVLRAYFPSILALAQSVLRSPDPCMVPFGGNMYLHSFAAFDSYCQQVGFLIVSATCTQIDMHFDMECCCVVS